MRKDLSKGNFKREISFAFYEYLRENNPELFKKVVKLNIGQFEHIISTPFRMLREVIKEGTFENVRIRYLGIFVVKEARIRTLANKIIKRYKNGEVDKKLFRYYIDRIIKYSARFPDKFKQEEVEEWMSLY